MGWGKLIGDFAKGYIGERGIEGTMDDLNSLKNGVSKLFGSNDDGEKQEERNLQYQQLWEEMLESLNNNLENQHYDAAFGDIDSFYRNYDNNEKDFYYYYWRAVIRLCIWRDSEVDNPDDNKLYSKVTSEIGQAKKIIYNEDQRNSITELKQALADVKESREREKANRDEANALLADLDTLRDPDNPIHGNKETDYDLSFQIIDEFNDKFGGEHDAFYFYLRTNVYNSMFAYFSRNLDRGKSFDPDMLKAKFAAAKNDAQKAVSLENDAETTALRDRINEQIQEIEQKMSSKQQSVSKKSQNSSSHDNTNVEKEYLDELKACLADDNQISDRERRLLNRLRESLGISEERAREIEDSLANGGLSDEEKEYVDALKDSLVDGVISDRERRLLDKLRNSLGISEDRAKELENSIAKNK